MEAIDIIDWSMILEYSPWVLVVLLVLQRLIPQANIMLREERERADIRYGETIRLLEARETTFLDVLQKLSETQAAQAEVLRQISRHLQEIDSRQENTSVLLVQILARSEVAAGGNEEN